MWCNDRNGVASLKRLRCTDFGPHLDSRGALGLIMV